MEFPSSYSFLAKGNQKRQTPKIKTFLFEVLLVCHFPLNFLKKNHGVLQQICCHSYCFKGNRVLKGTNTPILNVYLKYDFDKVILLLISLI